LTQSERIRAPVVVPPIVPYAAVETLTNAVALPEDEAESLRRSIERYRRLLREASDERLSRELKKMIEEAERRLKEIEGS
jgi:predicted  nucleic acid-binding Zn-ribbon protein